ncbi:MAG: protein-disulfide reductase DsbD [Betaproteobacteria bacterium]|nr:protein-disulfide reductase DsbD [Betaproteobacteria bacterium]MBU6512993.1 protein-disulfide reductase DsbD [Betaproteobacteria bacterium]MDE1956261.1 protein-disulfide reductase DsbD [Betaproteobacteria bacterium]MDE2153521.1 protein-disulfide reductase DsbD [Betaproteobacteria bacterium]MDE2479624.1 protein-disulfide reductase DsbD [Betaproteobacteria bacterium]
MFPFRVPPAVARWLAGALALFAVAGAQAQQGQFLQPDDAFRLSVPAPTASGVQLRFDIAKGYYLYQERFHFVSETPGVRLGAPDFPPAHRKFDPNLGHIVAHYRNQVLVPLPVQAAPAKFALKVTYQGCSDQGLCYPPIDKVVEVSLKAFGGTGSAAVQGQEAAAPSALGKLLGALRGGGPEQAAPAPEAASSAAPAAGASGAAAPPVSAASSAAPARQGAESAAQPSASTQAASTPPDSAQAQSSPSASVPSAGGEGSRIATVLGGGRLWAIVLVFVPFGLLLSFTPCVLPMVPILSSIVVGAGAGDHKVSRWRGLALAAIYSLGMALVYTAFGVAAGLLGHGLAAALQNPWVLSVFAALLVLLSLSMFGFYELQMPSSIQSRLSRGSSALPGGHALGVFVMGGISALIVGPCVAAPLAGTLLYISQTGNALIGGVALFSLAAGMSLPLLAVGAGASALLPHAGRWMDAVKALFGVLLLATALYMLAGVLPAWVQMLAWAALLVVSASFLHVFDRLPDGASGWMRLWKGLGVVLALAGAVLVVGVASGGRNVLQPLQGLGASPSLAQAGAAELRFAPVASNSQLDASLAQARGTVMLDFWADWCVSCKEMDHFTFTDPQVRSRLQRMQLLRADVTANNPADQALLKRFQLFGPPGIIFFRDGREIGRVVGDENAQAFLRSLDRVGA